MEGNTGSQLMAIEASTKMEAMVQKRMASRWRKEVRLGSRNDQRGCHEVPNFLDAVFTLVWFTFHFFLFSNFSLTQKEGKKINPKVSCSKLFSLFYRC